MNSFYRVFRTWPVALLLFSIMTRPGSVLAQEEQIAAPERDTLIAVAREQMANIRYCALITVDNSGHPQARIMDPFPPEDGMVVWLGTNPKSRKVREIRNDPRVTLFYADPEGGSYITITGTARLVDHPEAKAGRWKEGWESFYPDRENDYILIKVTPISLDVLSIKHGITGNQETWRTPSINFK